MEKNKFVPISELIEEYGGLENIIEKIQDYKLEAFLYDYQLIINNEEINNADFLIRSDSIFVEPNCNLKLDDTLIVDIQLNNSFSQMRETYENIKIKVKEIVISSNSLEINRNNPETFGHSEILAITITIPMMRKEDNYSRFRYLSFNNEIFYLSKIQSKVIWFLWKMYQLGQEEVESFELLSFVSVDTYNTKVRDLFRSNDGPKVLNKIIIQSSTRGRWTLAKDFFKSL